MTETSGFIRDAIRKSLHKKRIPPPLETYCRILPGDEKIHECGLVEEPTSLPSDLEVKTIYDILLRGDRQSNNGSCLGERSFDVNGKYHWLDYKTVIQNAQYVGSALIHLGLAVGQNSRVTIAGLHSPEYIIVGHALSSYSMVFVPLYYNYKFDDLLTIVNKTRAEVLFCDNYTRAKEYIDQVEELPTLKHIILLKTDKITNVPNGPIEGKKINLYDWTYILELGKNNLKPVNPPKPSDIYIICHTSGTTGAPKGAMISHRALVATMAGPTIQWFGKNQPLKLDHKDCYLSFLSPAHSYEQIMIMLITYYGGRIGVFSGSVPKLLDDIQTLKPTIVAFVPRLLAKFEAQIKGQLKQKNRLVQKLFDIAIKAKTKDLENGFINYNTIWDKTLFKPIHKLVGGRLRLIVTGGASISSEVKTFSRIVYGCPVLEGYGQTECAAAATLTLTNDTTVGHIGIPSPWAQIKLISVPQMGYNSENNEGEICLRGAGLMNGYFEEPELTSQTIDSEGWLKTGDIGRWRNNGTLELIDRKTNFFKLSQGDFVSPERVEQIYQSCPLISQIFITGQSAESYLVAIIVPVIEKLKELVGQNEELSKLLDNNESIKDGLQNDQIRGIALAHIRDYGKLKDLNELELIHNLYLDIEEFTTGNNLLTPTLKMKRTIILQKYSSIVDKMYSKNIM